MSVMSVMSVVNSPNLFVESGVIPIVPWAFQEVDHRSAMTQLIERFENDLNRFWTDFRHVETRSSQLRHRETAEDLLHEEPLPVTAVAHGLNTA